MAKREGYTNERLALDPLPYTPEGYQWVGCRTAYPVLRNGSISKFLPRSGYEKNPDFYS